MFRTTALLILVIVLLVNAQPIRADGPVTLGLGRLTSMALSPDGARLAVGTTIGVYFYDAQTFAPTGFWETAYPVNTILWSPYGDSIVLVGRQQMDIRVVESGALAWSVPKSGRYSWEPFEWAFDPDGAWLVVARGENLDVYDAASGAVIQSFQGRRDSWRLWTSYYAAAFSPDGRQLAVCCVNSQMQVFDVTNWQVVYTLPTSSDLFAWSADGRQIVTGGYAEAVIWDVVHRQRVGVTSPSERVGGLAFSPDGTLLAMGTEPGLVRIWSAGDWSSPLQILRGHQAYPLDLVWSPDGRTLYSAGGNTVRAWDAITGAQLRLLDGFSAVIHHVTWSADGQRVIAQQGEQLGSWEVSNRLPDQAAFLTASPYQRWGESRTRWYRHQATDLATSPAGDLLAVADATGITLHAATDLKPVRLLPTGYRVITVAFSPDGKYLASGGNSPFVVVWDVATGHPQHALLGSPDNFFNVALAFSVDGQSLYALEAHGLLRSWDLRIGASTTVQTPDPCEYCYYYFDPAIHPAAQRVASERRDDIAVSDATTGALLYSLEERYPRSIIINSQGTRVASITGDAIKIWHLGAGEQVVAYTGHAARITDIAFSPDGNSIASSSLDGTVRIWAVP